MGEMKLPSTETWTEGQRAVIREIVWEVMSVVEARHEKRQLEMIESHATRCRADRLVTAAEVASRVRSTWAERIWAAMVGAALVAFGAVLAGLRI